MLTTPPLDITHDTILLSPTDLRALISQLRAETQTSLRPSELAIGMGVINHANANMEASAVFLLADADCRGSFSFSLVHPFVAVQGSSVH
jgi:hypothetical protein